MSKSKSQKRREAIQAKAKRRDYRRYGMKKLPRGVKLAWVAQQNKHGWALGLGLNQYTVWLRNVRFANRKEVERALERTSVVFVQLKNNPEE